MFEARGKIIKNQRLSDRIFILTIDCEVVAKNANPGQFVMLSPPKITNLTLRRPFSLYNVIDDKQLSILLKVAGKGTQLLSTLTPEVELSLHGPLGNGFPLPNPSKKLLIVAGGVGAAPFYFFAHKLKNNHIKPIFLLGGKTKNEIPFYEDFKKIFDSIFITTEDGTIGKKGMITDYLNDFIEDDILIYASGPIPMLKKIALIAEKNDLDWFLSLESYMACGVGACLSCVVPAKNEQQKYLRCCKDGPIFSGKQIAWERYDC